MGKGLINNSMGNVIISRDVIAEYAGAQAMECFGIVGMAAKSKKDSVMYMLKKESLKKGIDVAVNDNKISLDFHVVVGYGLNIVSITENLMENVKYKLEEFTGMKVEKINVLIEGVRVID